MPQRFRHAAKPTWSKIPSVDHAARWQHPIVSSWSLRGQDFLELVDGLMYLFLQSGVRCAYATKKIAWRCTMAMRKCRQLAHSTTGSAARGTSRKREKERFLSTKGGSQNTPYLGLVSGMSRAWFATRPRPLQKIKGPETSVSQVSKSRVKSSQVKSQDLTSLT